MRNARSALFSLIAFVPLISAPALGQGVYGVSSGLVLEAWPNATPAVCPMGVCCGGTELIVSEGTYYIGGSPYALSRSAAGSETIYNGGTLGGGGSCGFSIALAADTPYYCYQTQCPSLVCGTTPPWPNGQPSAAIPIDGGVSGQGQGAIFVGSFLTDNNANIIPERRIGEELLLKVPADGGITTSFTLPGPGATIKMNAGIAQCSWPRVGNNCTSIQGIARSDTFFPFYPASASAGIFDVHVFNTNVVSAGVGHTNNYELVKFYDPVSYFNFPGPLQSTQAEIGTAGNAAAKVGEVETVRLTLNANKLPPPYSSQFSSIVTKNWGDLIDPDQPANVETILVLRGFIEPIQRLFSR